MMGILRLFGLFALIFTIGPCPSPVWAFDILDRTHCYDFIVLAHDSLEAAAQPLADEPRLRTCLIKTSDLLAAFSSDSLTVANLRDFVHYVSTEWRIAPSYLLLVGDECISPGPVPPSFPRIPSYVRIQEYEGGDYVDDGWVVISPSLGEKPLMHLGRIPAKSSQDLQRYVDKLIHYKSEQAGADWRRRVAFFVGDRNVNTDNGIMRVYADALMERELDSWPSVDVFYSADYDSDGYPDNAENDVRDTWDQGVALINSFGNTIGSCTLVLMAPGFCGPAATFTESLAPTNKFPVMFSATCLANYFYGTPPDSPYQPACVADDVLFTASDRGAIASFAPCQVFYAMDLYWMNRHFLHQLVSEGVRNLGRLCTYTEVRSTDSFPVLDMGPWQFCLLGDPTIQINMPVLSWTGLTRWESGAEIEQQPILQEHYFDSTAGVLNPNLRIVHRDSLVTAPCGERMVRAMARISDVPHQERVEWKLADLEVFPQRNTVLSFWIRVEQSPGGHGRVCPDVVLRSEDALVSRRTDITDQYGTPLDAFQRAGLREGWNQIYADLSNLDCWLDGLTLRCETTYDESGSLLVYLDDIRFASTNEWGGELLNPDFEEDANGDLMPDFWTDLDGEISDGVTMEDFYAVTGEYCMRVRDYTGSGRGAQQVVHLNGDREEYTLSVSARASLETRMECRVRHVAPPETLLAASEIVDREWRQFVWTFSNPWYPSDSPQLVAVEIVPRGYLDWVQGALVYVDSLRLTSRAPESPSPGHLLAELTAVPNPTNTTCEIFFRLEAASRVRLDIFDVNGRRVANLVDEDLPAGSHGKAWDGEDSSGKPVSSGVYFCRLQKGGGTTTTKIIVAR